MLAVLSRLILLLQQLQQQPHHSSVVITAVTDGEVDEDILIYFNDLRSNGLACRVINECNRLGRVEFGTDTSPAQVVYNAIKS